MNQELKDNLIVLLIALLFTGVIASFIISMAVLLNSLGK